MGQLLNLEEVANMTNSNFTQTLDQSHQHRLALECLQDRMSKVQSKILAIDAFLPVDILQDYIDDVVAFLDEINNNFERA